MHYGKQQGRKIGDNFVIYDAWSHNGKFILSYLVGIPSVINKTSNKIASLFAVISMLCVSNTMIFAFLKINLGVWAIMNNQQISSEECLKTSIR